MEKKDLILILGEQLKRVNDYDLLLERVLLNARIATNADAGSIYIKTKDNKLAIRYSQNDTLQKKLPLNKKLIYSSFEVPINEKTISGYVAMTGELLNIPDVYKLASHHPYQYNKEYDLISGYKTHSSLTIPLKLEDDEILGVLQLINAKDENDEIIAFDTELEPFVNLFANIATTQLERARFTRSLIDRMMLMTSLRDPSETAVHARRIGAYTVEIYEAWGRRRGIPAEQLEKEKDSLQIAAMLHDVGKIGISDLLLKKPGVLTALERIEMEQHTFVGYQIFKDAVTEFDFHAREVALRHHENWDGSGYPGRICLETGAAIEGNRVGLVGEEIPLFARIVSLCDVYDALSFARVYKKAWDEVDVLAEIKKLSSIKFDPEIVDIFFEIYPQIKNIKSRY